MQRIPSIDMMRGLVMVLMALDHTRDFFSNAQFDPLDLKQTGAAYFLTRWITHLCAPTFVFLAGVGAYLSTLRRNLSSRQLSGYLCTRGLWLIAMEFTLVRFGWTFNWDYRYAVGQVIWALGWSMLALAALTFLPRRAIALFAAVAIAGHNAFDAFRPHAGEAWSWLWTILHAPGTIEYLPGHTFFVLYPLIPWIAVMAAGYCLGILFLQAPQLRQPRLLALGLLCIGLFMWLRLNNLYGDPQPWLPQQNRIFTLFAVLNCEKYPPSLLYLLMTVGLMFCALALFERPKLQRLGRPLATFGNAPFFFYVLHLLVIHGAALAAVRYRGLPDAWLLTGSGAAPFPSVPAGGYGYDLAAVYAIWLALLVLLYPLCYAYAWFKRRYRDTPWLMYL